MLTESKWIFEGVAGKVLPLAPPPQDTGRKAQVSERTPFNFEGIGQSLTEVAIHKRHFKRCTQHE